MTEKEAIEVLKDFDKQVKAKADGVYQTNIGVEACNIAIKALEEVQQYRAIDTEIKKIFDGQLGLMDILKEYIEDIKKTHNGEKPRKIIALSNEDADKWESYKKIGTVEECRNAVEKQKSKKVFIIAASKIVCKGSYVFYKCPVCREQICSGFYYPPLDTYLGEKQYCENCGQAIDWSEED